MVDVDAEPVVVAVREQVAARPLVQFERRGRIRRVVPPLGVELIARLEERPQDVGRRVGGVVVPLPYLEEDRRRSVSVPGKITARSARSGVGQPHAFRVEERDALPYRRGTEQERLKDARARERRLIPVPVSLGEDRPAAQRGDRKRPEDTDRGLLLLRVVHAVVFDLLDAERVGIKTGGVVVPFPDVDDVRAGVEPVDGLRRRRRTAEVRYLGAVGPEQKGAYPDILRPLEPEAYLAGPLDLEPEVIPVPAREDIPSNLLARPESPCRGELRVRRMRVGGPAALDRKGHGQRRRLVVVPLPGLEHVLACRKRPGVEERALSGEPPVADLRSVRRVQMEA